MNRKVNLSHHYKDWVLPYFGSPRNYENVKHVKRKNNIEKLK